MTRGAVPARARTALLALLAGAALAASASPTPNEFEPCHRQTAALLQRCLDDAGLGRDDACWPRAREHNRACHAAVVRSHERHPPDRREAAQRAAREEAARALAKPERDRSAGR